MQLPNLDEKTRKELNELTAEEVSWSASWAYQHEILYYGIDAIAHAHLMRMAKDISEAKVSKNEFLKRYSMEFSGIYKEGFVVPMKKVESDGIFIPQQAYLGVGEKIRERKVQFFNGDYLNQVQSNSWVDKSYAYNLINRKWQPSDLENPELVEQGIKFGKDMWKTCIEGYDLCLKKKPQNQKVTDLSKKLILYYSALISEPTFR